MNCIVLLFLVVCACAAANSYGKNQGLDKLRDYEECSEFLCNNIITDADVPDAGAPDCWDWRENNAIIPDRHVYFCPFGSAIAVGNLEAQYSLKYKKQIILSAQQVMDCANGQYGNHGCAPSCLAGVFLYLMETGGIMAESDYPYLDHNGLRCAFNESKVVAKVADCISFNLTSQEKLKQALYKYGPISVALSIPLVEPTNDVWRNCSAGELHDVALLIGYGTDPKEGDYWMLQQFVNIGHLNFRIERGDNLGSCGILNSNMATVVVA